MTYTLLAEGTITSPGALRATGVHCGLKTTRSRDLGLLIAATDCSAAAHFGSLSGAAGAWSTAVLRRNPQAIRAVAVLSGVAGDRGSDVVAACDALAAFLADEAMLKAEQVLLLAAGPEQPFPHELIQSGLQRALDELYSAGGQRLGLAMALDDDQQPRMAGCQVVLRQNSEVLLGGVCVGQRLLLTTNATVAPRELQSAVDTILQHYPDWQAGTLVILATNTAAQLKAPAFKAWMEGLSALVAQLLA